MVTAVIGFVLGLGLAQLGQPSQDRLKYDTATYRSLLRTYGWLGIGIGFFVGAGQEYLRQAKVQRERDSNK